MVLNTFSYHLTPGGFIFDASARALGCAVIPAGPGNTEQQFELIEAYRPVGYSGTPDFLKILLDAAASAGRDVSSIKRALVSGAAFPKSLQDEVKSRGIDAYQAFGTADLGMVAFETPAREGMVVNEDLIMEIVRPGTGDPVAPGDVGEIVVTSLDPQHPWIRLALGDLTAALPGASPCGRTNMRIKGWMGRADQTTKVKGMFVRPEQIAEIGKRHPELGRLRLVVTRSGESDLRSGIGDTMAHGGGEIVVTSLDPQHPWIRLALGDLTAALPGGEPLRMHQYADQGLGWAVPTNTKVKGMFVRPEQIAEIGKRHPELGRLRLVVTRDGESDVMTLMAEVAAASEALRKEIAASCAR